MSGPGADAIPFEREGWAVGVRVGGGFLPVVQVLGIGRNYALHAAERGADVPERPLIFTKNPASLVLGGEAIVVPEACADHSQVDYEGELAVLIGAPARDVEEEGALRPVSEGGVVLGYCCANDVSARWWQKHGAGGQFWRGKSFDTFCPVGPALTPAERVADPGALTLTTTLSGERVQHASTSEMVFPVERLIAECSRGTTLPPGTLILTGTPSGVGAGRTPARFLRAGDTVEVAIGGAGVDLGVLRNPVEGPGGQSSAGMK